MRFFSVFLVSVFLFSSVGCAKKTASEQLQEDMKKASNQAKKELDAWK